MWWVKKSRLLRCETRKLGVELGDTLFALDFGEIGTDAGNMLHLKYDVGLAMMRVIMPFMFTCVSTTADPLVHNIVVNIKHSMVKLFASCIVNIGLTLCILAAYMPQLIFHVASSPAS